MIKYELTKAKKEDVENIFELYLKRINWMNEKNINQWNNNGYEVPAYYVHNFVTALKDGAYTGNRREKCFVLS